MNTSKNTVPATIDKQPPGVMLYFTLYEGLKALNDEQLGAMTRAMMEYGFFGVLPQFDSNMDLAWNFVKSYVDTDRQRYAEVVQRNRNAAGKRWQRENDDSKEAPAYQRTARTNRNGYGSSMSKEEEARLRHEGADWMKKYMNR